MQFCTEALDARVQRLSRCVGDKGLVIVEQILLSFLDSPYEGLHARRLAFLHMVKPYVQILPDSFLESVSLLTSGLVRLVLEHIRNSSSTCPCNSLRYFQTALNFRDTFSERRTLFFSDWFKLSVRARTNASRSSFANWPVMGFLGDSIPNIIVSVFIFRCKDTNYSRKFQIFLEKDHIMLL